MTISIFFESSVLLYSNWISQAFSKSKLDSGEKQVSNIKEYKRRNCRTALKIDFNIFIPSCHVIYGPKFQ